MLHEEGGPCGRRRSEAIVKLAGDFHAFRFRRDARDALINAQAQIFALDIFRRDANFLAQVQRGSAFGRDRFTLPLGYGALHHLAVHIEADGFDMTVLPSRCRAMDVRVPSVGTSK